MEPRWFECIGIDPGIRNVGLARVVVELHESKELYRIVHRESYKLDLLSEIMWERANATYDRLCSSRNHALSRFAQFSSAPSHRKRIKAWRPWRKKPPTSSRKVTQREMADLIFSIADWIVPMKSPIPRTVYIEAQPAGRASNAKTCCVSLSLFSSLRNRMRSAEQCASNLIAVEFIPPGRKYTDVRPRVCTDDTPSHTSCSPSRIQEVMRRGRRSRSANPYRNRKEKSCEIAKRILQRWKTGCLSYAEPGGHASDLKCDWPDASGQAPRLDACLRNHWILDEDSVRSQSRGNVLNCKKADDLADAIILADLALRDTLQCITLSCK